MRKSYKSKGMEEAIPLNEVGTKELHERHKVDLELPDGEKIGSARILDQTFMDKHLLEKKIELRHH